MVDVVVLDVEDGQTLQVGQAVGIDDSDLEIFKKWTLQGFNFRSYVLPFEHQGTWWKYKKSDG